MAQKINSGSSKTEYNYLDISGWKSRKYLSLLVTKYESLPLGVGVWLCFGQQRQQIIAHRFGPLPVM